MARKKRMGKVILSMLLSAVLVMEPLGTAAFVHAEEADGAAVQVETEREKDISQLEEQPDDEAGAEQEVEEDTEKNEEETGEPEDDQMTEETPKDEEEGNISEPSDDGEEGDISEPSGDGEEKPEEQPDGTPENPDGEAEPDDGVEKDDTEEQLPEEGDDIQDEITDESDETDQDVETEESVSENDLEEEEEEEGETLEGFTGMPENYHLNSAQMASKRELADRLDEIMELEEGSDYAERELVLLVDSEEEAEQVAKAYNAEIKKFQYGVLTLKLKKGDSVAKAMRAAANENVNLPAGWPNYYVYAYGEEAVEGSLTEESATESDDLIEIETTEYELETLGLTGVSAAASDEFSYRAAYTDPYLSPDSGLSYQYHHTVIGSPYAWEAGYTGTGVKVAVLDTGVGSNSDIPGVTEVGTNATMDLHGHGTHVAGIIAASANGQYGVGVAPGVQLYASNVLPNNGSGTIDDTMAGIRAVSGQAGSSIVVDVINMSLGGFGYSGIYQDVITKAYDQGVAIFAAAGNDGGSNYNYPACYDHVISIAATDQGNTRASFSNYGAKVDLSAPGVDINSTNVFEGQSGETYITMSGTSMACPVAVGEAAVILSANLAELQGKTGGSKVDALLEVMQKNAIKVSGSGMGKGITDLTKALNINTAYEKPAVPNINITPDGMEQKVTVTMTAQFGAEIYYTDNGKNPVYKNGAPDANTKLYEGVFDIEDRAKCDLRAIAVNAGGVCSKVVKKTYNLKPYVTNIEISGVNQVAKGKSIQLSAAVTPTYAVNKAVTWEIYTADANGEPDQKIDKSSDGTLKTGVSITAKGKVAASKTAKAGNYIVKVTAKDEKKDASNTVIHAPFSTTYPITVTDAVKISSAKFNKNKITLVMPTTTECDLKTMAEFEAKQKDSTGSLVDAAASDFRWSSNKTDVATVDANGVVTLHKAGKAVITALANDSSNKKATCTITVQRLASGVSITGSSVVGKSKSNTYKAAVTPADTTNKKVTWSLSEKDAQGQWIEVDANRAKAIGVSINAGSGKLSTTKKAVAGQYLIKAVTKDAAQAEATKEVTVKDGLITKITVEPASATIYRKTNDFEVPTSTQVRISASGTNADLSAYTVTSSDTEQSIVTVTEGTRAADGSMELTVSATGKATGKVTITVKATDGSNKSGKCTINVNNSSSGIRIAPTGSNNQCVSQGKSLQLKAVLETGNGTITNKKVEWAIFTDEAQPKPITPETDETLKTGMSINAKGKVSAAKTAKTGWYVVCAYADGGKTLAIYPIRVDKPTTILSLDGLDTKYIWVFDVGYSYYVPIIADTRQGGFSFSSSNPSVVSVGTYTQDSTGKTMEMVAYKTGSATITVKALDGSGKSVKYKIKIE